MKKITLALVCVCISAILGCGSQSTKPRSPAKPSQPPVTWTKDAATTNEQENSKATVTSQLKDPESARFGEIWAMNGTNGKRTICGYINAKNSYGGYTGQKMFTLNNGSVIMQGTDILGSLLPEICTPRTVN